MDQFWAILIVVTLTFISTPLALLMFWFDDKITRNPYLRMQANFECVFGLFFAPLALAGYLAEGRSSTMFWVDAHTVFLGVFIYCMNCLLLSFPAMLGRRSASAILFYLAWPRLLFPCAGWFVSFFSIRYYLLGMRQFRDGMYAQEKSLPPRDRL